MSDSEDEDRQPIAREIVADSTSGFSFEMVVRQHYEHDSAMEVRVTYWSKQRKRKAGEVDRRERVGKLEGILIRRNFGKGFHMLCDAESQGLQHISVVFCNDDGSVRYGEIDGLSSHAASRGGFLNVSMISLQREHRRKDLGVRGFKALLEWLNKRDETSWSLCVIQPGAENERRFDAPILPDEEQSAIHRKICLQYARLGFVQARFGCEFWYLLPERLVLLTKQDVAAVQITKMPQKPETAQEDKPLVQYLLDCAFEGAGVKNTFCNDVRRLAQGGDLQRAAALPLAVDCGVSELEHLRVLVSLGASVDDTDHLGRTALHHTTLDTIIMGSGFDADGKKIQTAKSLIALGANRGAKDVLGLTPLDSQLRHIRDMEDLAGAFGLNRHGWNGRDDEKGYWELASVLLDPTKRDTLKFGVVTQRQWFQLEYLSEMLGDCRFLVPEFQNRVPLPEYEMHLVPLWNHIPGEVRGAEVYKSFAMGWVQVLEAISKVVTQEKLPTPQAVEASMRADPGLDWRYDGFFRERGGRIEFALDGLLCQARDGGIFFDAYDDAEDDEDYSVKAQFNALPEHPLDSSWSHVRHKLLGPRGKVKAGPFASVEDEDGEEGFGEYW